MGAAALHFATRAHEHHAAAEVVWPAAALVVAASTVVHGVTASPARMLYARVEGERGDPDAGADTEPADREAASPG